MILEEELYENVETTEDSFIIIKNITSEKKNELK